MKHIATALFVGCLVGVAVAFSGTSAQDKTRTVGEPHLALAVLFRKFFAELNRRMAADALSGLMRLDVTDFAEVVEVVELAFAQRLQFDDLDE